LDALKSVSGGFWEAGEERVAVVNARENKRDNKFGSSVNTEIFSD
jgi:hypothetical protein